MRVLQIHPYLGTKPTFLLYSKSTHKHKSSKQEHAFPEASALDTSPFENGINDIGVLLKKLTLLTSRLGFIIIIK